MSVQYPKPKISYVDNSWQCLGYFKHGSVNGIGSSPVKAYEDFLYWISLISGKQIQGKV